MAVEARLPVSVVASLSLHAGGLLLYLLVHQASQTVDIRTITDVDLIVAAAQPPRALAPRPAPAPVSMKDFLKMALPSIPKPQAPSVPLELKLPETQRRLMALDAPKLDDRGRLQKTQALAALDLGRKRDPLARLELGAPLREARAPALEAPLADVGVRKASRKALAMAALEEERTRSRPQPLAALPSAQPLRSRGPLSAAPLPTPEASREKPASSRLADMLPAAPPQPLALQPRALPALPKRPVLDAAPAAQPKPREGLQAAPKKSVEIEGPLSGRQVITASVPPFPAWAKDQGIAEADVSIRFYVDPAGRVLESLRVEKTSGFGRIDRLAMEHLKLWRFAPTDPSSGNQWGIITFRFLLE